MTIDTLLIPVFYFLQGQFVFELLGYILGVAIICGIVYNILE